MGASPRKGWALLSIRRDRLDRLHRWSISLHLRADASDRTLHNTTRNRETRHRGAGSAWPRGMSQAASSVLIAMALLALPTPEKIHAQKAPAPAAVASASAADASVACGSALGRSHSGVPCPALERLIVIGFMGGRISAGNLVHKEALLARDLDRRYPNAIYAATFANRHEPEALRTVLHLLGTGKDGRLSPGEKSTARIVIYGHSWGASEAVNFARKLGQRGIPVLLTIQVDSIEKSGEDDATIPSNVMEAINFYQTRGWLHGRRSIQAEDPQHTEILGNFESTYKNRPVSCAGFSWYARAFMKPHIEIENDTALWNRIEDLIVARLGPTNVRIASRSSQPPL